MIIEPRCNNRPTNVNINESKQLLVEGEDDRRVFGALIKSLSVEGIQIHNYGGKTNFRNFLRNFIEDDDFEKVRSIGVQRDADTSTKNAIRSVKNALTDLNLPSPSAPVQLASEPGVPGVAYIVVPGYKSSGSIEDVCLDSVADYAVMDCVESYMACLGKVSSGNFSPTPKARAYSYLASRNRPNLRVGEAAEAGVWNFGADSFSSLRDFVQLL